MSTCERGAACQAICSSSIPSEISDATTWAPKAIISARPAPSLRSRPPSRISVSGTQSHVLPRSTKALAGSTKSGSIARWVMLVLAAFARAIFSSWGSSSITHSVTTRPSANQAASGVIRTLAFVRMASSLSRRTRGYVTDIRLSSGVAARGREAADVVAAVSDVWAVTPSSAGSRRFWTYFRPCPPGLIAMCPGPGSSL